MPTGAPGSRKADAVSHPTSKTPPATTPGQKLKVRIEIVVVDGPDGQHLRARQAAAMRRALRWFAAHPTPPDDTETDPS